ncbi:MAG: glycosyltransferase [Desulfovibrio sp.]|nr:glycosyltransferase [Desulfovibrio sp.]
MLTRKLLWIGNPFFSRCLDSCGWQTAFYNFTEMQTFGWSDLTALAGFEPDVVVVADKSMPPFVLGMEDFPCLTVFYSVDSHIHSWFPLYAQGFDLCLVSLKDHVSHFHGPFLTEERVIWSPPYAPDTARPKAAGEDSGVSGGNQADGHAEDGKTWDCLFVGTVNENLPKRTAFLKALSGKMPGLHAQSGSFFELFPKGRVLLNQCEHGDLNFRVFEALGMGGCLVTPRIGHGLTDIFTEGVHLALYEPNDVDDAFRQIQDLLRSPEIRASMARAGLAVIDAEHRAHHRASAFTSVLNSLWKDRAAIVAARRSKAAAIRETCLKLPYLLWAYQTDAPVLKEAWLNAAKGVTETRKNGSA